MFDVARISLSLMVAASVLAACGEDPAPKSDTTASCPSLREPPLPTATVTLRFREMTPTNPQTLTVGESLLLTAEIDCQKPESLPDFNRQDVLATKDRGIVRTGKTYTAFGLYSAVAPGEAAIHGSIGPVCPPPPDDGSGAVCPAHVRLVDGSVVISPG